MSRMFSTEFQLLTPEEAAEQLGVTVKTLANWRCLGAPLPFYKLNRKLIRYKMSDIKRFLNDSKKETEKENTG